MSPLCEGCGDEFDSMFYWKGLFWCLTCSNGTCDFPHLEKYCKEDVVKKTCGDIVSFLETGPHYRRVLKVAEKLRHFLRPNEYPDLKLYPDHLGRLLSTLVEMSKQWGPEETWLEIFELFRHIDRDDRDIVQDNQPMSPRDVLRNCTCPVRLEFRKTKLTRSCQMLWTNRPPNGCSMISINKDTRLVHVTKLQHFLKMLPKDQPPNLPKLRLHAFPEPTESGWRSNPLVFFGLAETKYSPAPPRYGSVRIDTTLGEIYPNGFHCYRLCEVKYRRERSRVILVLPFKCEGNLQLDDGVHKIEEMERLGVEDLGVEDWSTMNQPNNPEWTNNEVAILATKANPIELDEFRFRFINRTSCVSKENGRHCPDCKSGGVNKTVARNRFVCNVQTEEISPQVVKFLENGLFHDGLTPDYAVEGYGPFPQLVKWIQDLRTKAFSNRDCKLPVYRGENKTHPFCTFIAHHLQWCPSGEGEWVWGWLPVEWAENPYSGHSEALDDAEIVYSDESKTNIQGVNLDQGQKLQLRKDSPIDRVGRHLSDEDRIRIMALHKTPSPQVENYDPTDGLAKWFEALTELNDEN